jgi:hypothetical protein
MSIYYPIELLPENPELGEPKNRNYLRNNLPYGDTKTENNINNNNSIVEYGKKETYLSSSINNTKPSTEFNDLANKTNITSNVDNKTKKRSTKINIDSRLRNQKPKNILDTTLNNLSNALYFTKNSNILTIYQPNHGLITEDKIVLEFATSKNVKIKQGLSFQKGSTFAKISQTNHGMINGYTYYILISNVSGNTGSGTYLLNYPVNLINTKQLVYFQRNSTDIFNSNYYYIDLGIAAESDFTYEYSFNVQYLNIRSIPLNQINANYPISADRISGYHNIENVINNNYYQVQLTNVADSSTVTSLDYTTVPSSGDGNDILIVKVLNNIDGYPDPNNYVLNLQKNFYKVSKINLLNSIFPITQKIVNATPASIQNNLFYWQNLPDGATIYSVQIPTGNYTLPDLQLELTNQIQSVIRPNIDSTQLVNNIYTYNTNIVKVTINEVKNSFSIQFFQQVILTNAIFKSKSDYPDGFTRIIINYTNHGLVIGNSITLSNVIGTEEIPASYLNGIFTVETVIDLNTFTIRLNRYNSDPSIGFTNGGTAITLLNPIKSRLLFSYPNTIGNILGFNNVGAPDSITPYNYTINNYDLYDIDIQVNSIGVATQPRQDTRILNVNPNNYILILTDIPFYDQINLFNTETYAFAKIMLAGNVENYVYDQFIQLGSIFKEPLATLSSINFSFYSPDKQLYDFNGIDHSFTIEIIEDLDDLDVANVT